MKRSDTSKKTQSSLQGGTDARWGRVSVLVAPQPPRHPPPRTGPSDGGAARPGGAPAPVASGAWRNDGIQNECSAFHSEGLVEGQGAL